MFSFCNLEMFSLILILSIFESFVRCDISLSGYSYNQPMVHRKPSTKVPSFGSSSGYSYSSPVKSIDSYRIPFDVKPPPILPIPNQNFAVNNHYNNVPSNNVFSGYSYNNPAPQQQNYYNPGPAQVHKHIYIHTAPEDFEQAPPRIIAPPVAPRKHYKIIFIKAPSQPSAVAPIIPQQQQTEEKTLVYVLVKKPERPEDIVIPTSSPPKVTRPEVYFIKYNTRKAQIPTQIPKNLYTNVQPTDSIAIDNSVKNNGYGSEDTNLKPSYGPPVKK